MSKRLRRAGASCNGAAGFARGGCRRALIYLAQAESDCLPQAVSRAGARGIWQFMFTRGASMVGDGLVGGRAQDPEKATHAAARDLRDMYGPVRRMVSGHGRLQLRRGDVQHARAPTGYADFGNFTGATC